MSASPSPGTRNAADQVYNFTPANADYATKTIAGLWYSWANYYAMNVRFADVRSPRLDRQRQHPHADQPPAGLVLVPGMGVTATGLPAGCIILSVSPDDRTIELRAVPQGNNNPTSFSFTAPSLASIASSNPNTSGNVNFTFPSSDSFAMAFAQTVYLVIAPGASASRRARRLVGIP